MRVFGEVYKNLMRNKLMSLITILSISIIIFLVGIVLVINLNIDKVIGDVESNVEAVVYVEEDFVDVESVGLSLGEIDGVRDVTFIDKDTGLENLIEDLGKGGKAFEGLREDNPLSDIFIVKLDNPVEMSEKALLFEKVEGVERVDYGEEIIEILFAVTDKVSLVGYVLVLGLGIGSVMLILNMIKMSIEYRKEEIKIMKLVGAKDSYIRLPFIVEGLFVCLVGVVLTLLVLSNIYSKVLSSYNSSLAINFAELLSLGEVVIPISFILLISFTLLGLVGSYLSIRRYLEV